MSQVDRDYLTFSLPSPDNDNDGGAEDEAESSLQIRLHQAPADDSNQGENETNTGFVMWPSAVMLAHHLTRNPDVVAGAETLDGDILELGSGVSTFPPAYCIV